MPNATDPSLSKEATSDQTNFRWIATDSSGHRHEGESIGTSSYEVRTALRKTGLQIEWMMPRNEWRLPRWSLLLVNLWNARQCQVRRSVRADICDSIATLLEAGMPLEQALSCLERSSARPFGERRLLRHLRDQIRDGNDFSETLTHHPDWFDAFDIALIRSGQHAGDIINALHSLAEVHFRSGSLRQKLLGALAYPAILLCAGFAVWIFMSVRLLPQLVDLLKEGHRTPPWLSIQVMSTGQWIAHWWPLVAAIVIACVAWTHRASPSGRYRKMIARIVQFVPWSHFFVKSRIALLALALARLRRGGVPLLDALHVVGETITDKRLRLVIRECLDALQRGEDFSSVLARSSPTIDPEFAQLVQVGEQSGELTPMLERIGERYHRAAERAADRLSAVLGPIAIIFLAFLIGILVMSCILPLAKLGELV